MARILTQLQHAWNALTSNEESRYSRSTGAYGGVSYGTSRPDRVRINIANERSIITSIYTRIAVDTAGHEIRHVRLSKQKRYQEDIDSGLNNCLTMAANIDQEARDFKQDLVMTMLDKGVAAIVPIDTTINPNNSEGYDILTMRVGEVKEFLADEVVVSVWNQEKQVRQDLRLHKSIVGIVYNPLYAVMNEPNSTLQRLIRKLNLLDTVDEQSSSGKLDIIIQLPYVIKSEARRLQAEQRRKDIEFQLKGSQYGIAYTDGTEKITQLNRPAENNLMNQVQYLTEMLYGQLGITEEVMNGTADAKTMLNYYNRTVKPILDAVVEAMRHKFLSKTARTRLQSVMYFRDPFALIPIDQLAEIADKFTRNEIASANDMRTAIGWTPSSDPKADELRNSNMPAPSETATSTQPKEGV